MKNLLIIILLITIYIGVITLQTESNLNSISTLLVGIMLLTSFLFANLIKGLKLPKLTGYMIMGILLGPVVLNLLTREVMEHLVFLENIALSFIAITAGGELKLKAFAKRKKSILFIFLAQSLLIFFGVCIFFIIIANYIPSLAVLSQNVIFGFAILLAAAAMSTSPATTIGIITELKSKGNVTDLVLSVTLIKTIFLVSIFPLLLAWSKTYLLDQTVFDLSLILNLLKLIGSSIFAGTLLGILVIWYITKVRVEISLFLLSIVIAIAEISQLLGLEILLTSIIVGFVVQNFSKQGESLIQGIELFSLPIYVIFFCFAGANLNLNTLFSSAMITLLLILSRAFFIYSGTLAGSILAKENLFVINVSWMGYIGQAGIALGLGIIISRNFPGDIGQHFLTILISTVVLNEMIGPILFKYVLVKAGESRA